MSAEPAFGVMPIHGAAVAAILKLLDGQRLMTLATNRADGWPQASTLGYLNDGLNLYFVTARDSEKLRNITADPRVGVAVRGVAGEGEAVGLSIDGRAEEVTDGDEVQRLNDLIHKGSPEISPWAPGGDSVAVVKVIPERVEAVAVIDGRSRAQTFSIGDPDRVVHGVSYEPSAVARLF
ncbi:pyridoxamine 5'-phosphate oxidase family protein [uncultured Brevundimonas sp.]|uniref:pyridoxamine 5'-phosphate oxidase family protein n=1 Tax=uncultured Brevundimonas sp. TaxID=213418 RepID=UPI0025D3A07E|nr:pyridoxamine 5'-phosphate oxidase family protein [uncultured Brevundimonas sp.]